MKKFSIYTLLVLSILILGVAVASANGTFSKRFNKHSKDFTEHNESMLEKKAEVLGLSIEDLRSDLEEGKSFKEITEERGIDLVQIKEEFKSFKSKETTEYYHHMMGGNITSQGNMGEYLEKMKEFHKDGEEFSHKKLDYNKFDHGMFGKKE